MTKQTFTIAVSWSVYAEMEVQADTLEEAKKIAEAADLPVDPEYIDGSFEINDEVCNELNKGKGK